MAEGIKAFPGRRGFLILANRDPTDTSRLALPNGGIFTTAADYGRFARMLLCNGTLDGKTYLRPETVTLMRTIQTGDLKAGFSAVDAPCGT